MQELVLIQPNRTAAREWARNVATAQARSDFDDRLAECGPLAYRVARGVLRNDADAEDVAQEALLRAYRRFDRLRDRNRFRAPQNAANSARHSGHSRLKAHRPRLPKTLRRPANFGRTSNAPSNTSRRSCVSFCSSLPCKATRWTK
jgi:hypothetical protein